MGFCFFLSPWTVNILCVKDLMSSCKFTVLFYHGSCLSIVTQLSCKLAVSWEVSSKVTQFCCVKTRPWITDSWTPRRRIHTKLRCEISMSYAVPIPLRGHTVNSSCKVIWTALKITGFLQEKPCNLSLLCAGHLPISVVLCVFLTLMCFIIGSLPGLRQWQVVLIWNAYGKENFFFFFLKSHWKK